MFRQRDKNTNCKREKFALWRDGITDTQNDNKLKRHILANDEIIYSKRKIVIEKNPVEH